MQFHIDTDAGNAVTGWLVPTKPDAVPTILVRARGGSTIELRANRARPDLVKIGVHATGVAGFLIDGAVVPGLNPNDELELRDGETNLLIYRRPRREVVEVKLFRYTQGFGVQSALDRALASHFTLAYENCGEFPFPTMFAVLNNQTCPSILASGAMSYHRYQQLCEERGFLTCSVLKNPFDALAEMLLSVEHAFRTERVADSQTLPTSHCAPLAPWFESLDAEPLADDAWLEQAFSNLTGPQRSLLSNPCVRALACNDEPADRRHVSIALENLANLSLAGVDDDLTSFGQILSELSGVGLADDLDTSSPPEVRELSERLSRLGAVADLLSLDITFYDYAREATRDAARHLPQAN